MDAPKGEIMKIAAALGVAVVLATATVVGQQPETGEPRGELLYSTYCIGCHTTQFHWREKRLATDWTSLKSQVRRWQESVGLAPDDDDVVAIATYLNGLYYHFPAPDTKRRGDANGPDGLGYVEGPARSVLGAR
jgi:mono/diheme cytochrome c family protein